MSGGYIIRNAADVAPVACPCGEARRIVTSADGGAVSVHRVTISQEAKKHYHRRLTEYYYILSGEGEIELDDERRPVKPGDVIVIRPGVAHVLRGEMEILNIVSPPFDPADEYVVE